MNIHHNTHRKTDIAAGKLHHLSSQRKVSVNIKEVAKELKPTIILYSPDMDFCVSLRMLLQNTYEVLVTTEPDILMMMVKSFKPDVVIVDALPTERMRNRFSVMRKEHPKVRIMMFYASSMESPAQHESIRQYVDAAFSKPIDIVEVLDRIKVFAMSTR